MDRVTSDVLHASAEVSTNLKDLGAGAVIELVGMSGNVNIPIFWSGHDIVITGTASLGGIGVDTAIGTGESGMTLIYGVGGGVYFSIKKHGE